MLSGLNENAARAQFLPVPGVWVDCPVLLSRDMWVSS